MRKNLTSAAFLLLLLFIATACQRQIAGTRDDFYPPARVANYEPQLRQRAGDVQFRSYDAEHEISAAMREDIREWLKQKASV